MKDDQATKWAKVVGRGLAHVQDGVDFFVEMGFTMMRKAGKNPEQEVVQKDENKYLSAAKAVGRGALRFLGTAGDEFYKKYESLKEKKSSKTK